MSDSVAEFGDLMRRVRGGCPEAARELTERFGPHLLRMVRRKLARRLRCKFDSTDFVQDVWASFFLNPPREREFDQAETLVAFLAALARNKIVNTTRRHYCDREVNRDPRPVRSEAVTALDPEPFTANQPTPSQVAVANETWDRLLAGLPAHHQRIVLLLRHGNSPAEAARLLGVTERTVFRVLSKLDVESASS